MPDTKINSLVAITLPAAADVVPIVDDTGVTPVTRKITHDDLLFGANGTPSTQAHSDSAAVGSALDAARSDHKHAMPAAGGSQIATGGYTGDGATARGITGVGFAPKYVMLTYDAAVGSGELRGLVWTYDTIAGGQSVTINSATESYSMATFLIKSLDSDGFTVDDDGGDSHPNKNSQVYNYLAIG